MNRGKVFVYAADTKALKEDSVFAAGYSRVSEYRKKKIDRFLFQKDKMLSLGAEMLLQYCLSEHGVASYQIKHGKHGKPYLQSCVLKNGTHSERKQLYFNLSHSEERVMCVVSDMEVGCDVEKIDDVELEIAKRFFALDEYEKILSQKSKKEQNELFFRLWTTKESFVKATGLGIAQASKNLRMDIRDGQEGYHFKEYDLTDGYCYAVCGLAEAFDETIRWVDLKLHI